MGEYPCLLFKKVFFRYLFIFNTEFNVVNKVFGGLVVTLHEIKPHMDMFMLWICLCRGQAQTCRVHVY